MKTNMELKTKLVFCANEQKEIDHTVTIDGNGEWLFTCTVCGRALKFPASMSGEEVKAQLAQHVNSNTGQVTQAVIDAKVNSILDETE